MKSIVHGSDVEDETRPPHDGEYVGTIEVVVLRCHHTKKQPIDGNETSSNESFEVNENTVSGYSNGASDPQPIPKSNSKSKYRTHVFGLDGGWEDWGPPPPTLDEPRKGRIEMTSENKGTWNPVGQAFTSSNALEKTERWNKRSDSREHFRSDFQKSGTPAGSQRGRTTDREDAPDLSLRGGGPDSYSIASSEAMRNWNRGPPARKEWAQGDRVSKGGEALPPAIDPWTANLPIGDPENEAEAKPEIPWGVWGTKNGTRSKPGSKKGKKSSIISRSPERVPSTRVDSNDKVQDKKDGWRGSKDQNQGGGGNGWGTFGETRYGSEDWGGAGNTQNQDGWNSAVDCAQGNNGFNWNSQNENGKKRDSGWDPPDDTSNGNKDDWRGNENNDMQQKGDWGATTGNDAQQGNSWEGKAGQQTDTWGDDNAKQATSGAKDPEKISKAAGCHSATGRGEAGSSFSFGNSRATGPILVCEARSQGRPASVKSEAASIKPSKKPVAFDWLKPSLGKTSNASGSPVTMEKASFPGAGALPVVSSKQADPNTMTAQTPSTFSISTLPKPKPYWSTWRSANTVTEADIEQAQPPSPEELQDPLYSIRAEVAQRNMMSHQVRPGCPAAYTHKRNKPKYMDTHESPYAVFLFKYRDKEIIEHKLKTTINEPEFDEKARLASLSKQELIDELVKMKSKLSVVKSDSSGRATFVKKLDEKLSKLENSGEDAPAIGDWVKATSPTNCQEGICNAGAWGTNGTHKGNGGRDPSNGNENSNDNANGNGGELWGGNVNGNHDWKTEKKRKKKNNNNDNDKGNGDTSNATEGNGNDWGTANHNNDNNGDEKKEEVGNGWGWNDNGRGDDWNNNDKNDSVDTKSGGDWGNDDGNKEAAGEWGNDHDQGEGISLGNDHGGGGGGGDGGRGGKKDEGHVNGDDNAGFEGSWGANTW